MTKLLNRFYNWYQFDIMDIVSMCYLICAVGIIRGFDMNLLFAASCFVSFLTVLRCGRFNMLVLNASMLMLNLFYLLR